MATHVLMLNLRGSSWDFIPDDMWRNIVQRFAAKVCNRVSFESVTTAEDLKRLAVFSDHAPAHIGNATNNPLSVPWTCGYSFARMFTLSEPLTAL